MPNKSQFKSGPWYDTASQYQSVGENHHTLEVFEEEKPPQVHENTGSVLHQVLRHKQLHAVLLNMLVFRYVTPADVGVDRHLNNGAGSRRE